MFGSNAKDGNRGETGGMAAVSHKPAPE